MPPDPGPDPDDATAALLVAALCWAALAVSLGLALPPFPLR